MADDSYNPHEIEPKWQALWESERAFAVPNPAPGEPEWNEPSTYVLEMLPYPSGELHMGHVKNYTLGDVVAHFRRRNGWRVLRPMGYDAFGLPAENAAIKEGGQPRAITERNIGRIREQMRRMGWAIDWEREISTHTPEYYRWTQLLFLKLLERGLAYRKESLQNWCPNDQTVLANEQVVDGRCERCGAEVEKRSLEQWFFRITDYAEALLDEMELLEHWPERVLTMQRNWIGRSEGAEVVFRVEGTRDRPAGLHDAPGHALRRDLLRHGARAPARRRARRRAARGGGGARLRQAGAGALVDRARGEGEGRRLHGAQRDQPGQRRADSDLGRRLRADGVRDGRDHGGAGARRARPRLRPAVRAADRAGDRAARGRDRRAGRGLRLQLGRGRHGQLGRFLRPAQPAGEEEDHRLAGRGGARRGDGLLPAARLADLAPALLGLPDPGRLLRALRRRAGARRGAAGAAARGVGVSAQGPLAARHRRGVGGREVPVLRRRGQARDRHAGHLRRLLLVLHPLLRPAQLGAALEPRDRRSLDAGRPVHRRHRARDPAPDVRALLHQGAQRPGHARLPRALRPALHAGDDLLPRRQDVQVEGQRGRARRDDQALTAPTRCA